MTSYTVQPGDSWARIAGTTLGNERQYLELAKHNGGMWGLHPGDVIDIPDAATLPTNPVITNAQFANSPTGYQNGQPTYRAGAATPGSPAVGNIAAPALPARYGSAGVYDSRTGASQGTTPVAAANQANAAPKSYGPNSAGTYDKRTGRDAGVVPPYKGVGTGGLRVPPSVTAPPPVRAPGASRMATGAFNDYAGPMGGGQGPAQGQNIPNPPGFGQPQTLADMARNEFAANGFPVRNLTPEAPGLRVPGSVTTPQKHTTAVQGPPAPESSVMAPGSPGMSMPQVAEAARWTGEALYAFAGGYGKDPTYYHNPRALPTVIPARVANELPVPQNFADLGQFMTALGYLPDAQGNWRVKEAAVNMGYGGAAGLGGATQVALPYSPYSYGGYGGGRGGESGVAASASPGLASGLLRWNIAA